MGATYKTTEDEWIGTIPIGYADGLRRGLRGQEVLIGGRADAYRRNDLYGPMYGEAAT